MPLSEVTIFPTTKCNLGCKHCGIDRNVKNETMDDGLLERLLNDLCDTDAGIVITGGEPLLYNLDLLTHNWEGKLCGNWH